ncbi:MAG: hypothetical protein AB9860_06095 [Methanomassiliicoccales archaeon]
MSPWKDQEGPLALIVGMTLVTAIVLGVLAFAPLNDFTRNDEWSYLDPTPMDSLNISINAEVCDVEVVFEDLAEGWVAVSMNIEGRSGAVAGDPGIHYGVAAQTNGANLTVSVVLSMKTGPTVSYDDSDIVVVIDRSLLSFVSVDVDVGDVRIEVPEGAVLAGAYVHTNVGGLHLNLQEGAMVMDDLNLESDVGSVNLDCLNVIFADETVIRSSTGTGSIFLNIEQSLSPQGNVTFDCTADVGSVHLNLAISGVVSGEITSQVDVGDIEAVLEGFSGMDVHLVSDNHPDNWSFELLLEADVGSVYIDAKWRE